MKPIYIFSFCLASLLCPVRGRAAVQTVEPSTSVMASGKWVKIRITADGVYELSHQRLRELGFSNPEKVNVFGYCPTLLLTHEQSQIPADLSPMQSVHESGKLLFYAKSNVDMEKEVWSSKAETVDNIHSRHSHSYGATYFLSDVPVMMAPEIGTIAAPSEVDATSALTSHDALVYHEDDAVNYAEGGYWFAGEALNRDRTEEKHVISVRKAATGNAQMLYTCIMSPTRSGGSYQNYLLASYDNGVESEASTGVMAPIFNDAHQYFSRAARRQQISLPENATQQMDFSVTFTIHPQASVQTGNCALDYFALTYERRNDLENEAQMQMYFLNINSEADFALSGMSGDSWSVWDVTEPASVKKYDLTEAEGVRVGHLTRTATATRPNVVVAFRSDMSQPEPEILGDVESQNLHAMETPDLVVLTSSLMMPAAEFAADFHRNNQGIDVAVIDQQKIFNEYGSGNVSPEAVRRFMSHLYNKNPQKLKAMLIVGPATYKNATLVNDGSPYVISAETEDNVCSTIGTMNVCTDAFFGHLGPRCTVDLWNSRCAMYQVFGSGMQIGVGRLPFLSEVDIRTYYRKAESYMAGSHKLPMAGHILLASDYADASIDQHMANAESLANSIGAKANSTVTVTRAASNLYSKTNNTLTRTIMQSSLERGTLMFAYFGHGGFDQIGGSNATLDHLLRSASAASLSHAGRYPLIYLGSCHTTPIDRYSSCIGYNLVLNETGGGIALIASCRDVYQEPNMLLGNAVARNLYNAEPGEWLGTVWAKALTSAVTPVKESKNKVTNHLTYNFIGDPALPVFSETGSVSLSAVNGADGELIAGGNNVVTGSVLDAAGNIDAEFNGEILLTVYDVPQVLKNVATGSTQHQSYVAEVTTDHEIIGEYRGKVVNGEFSLSFIGPNSVRSGNHRLQAYAFSSDGTRRGLGYLSDVAMVQNENEVILPEAAPVTINGFQAGNGRADELLSGKITLTAEIEAPAGIAPSSVLENPVRLLVDGVAYANATRLLNVISDGKYELTYNLGSLSLGRHEATLSVLDALGNWADATIEFVTFNAPMAQLSASVAEGTVSFELDSEIDAADVNACRLIIENLQGDPVKVNDNASFPCVVELPAGAYRAFVQLEGGTRRTSTDKVELLID